MVVVTLFTFTVKGERAQMTGRWKKEASPVRAWMPVTQMCLPHKTICAIMKLSTAARETMIFCPIQQLHIVAEKCEKVKKTNPLQNRASLHMQGQYDKVQDTWPSHHEFKRVP